MLQQSTARDLVGQRPYLTLEGQWRVETEVRRANVDDADGVLRRAASGLGGDFGAARWGWDNPAPGLSWNEFGGFVILAGRAGVGDMGVRLGRVARPRLVEQRHDHALLRRGRALAVRRPPRCRNAGGSAQRILSSPIRTQSRRGGRCSRRTARKLPRTARHTTQGLDLNPYPLDLTVHTRGAHRPSAIFTFIHDGVPGQRHARMGQGRPALEEQIWHLVNFLRTLGAVNE